MCQSRISFKRTLKECIQSEERLRANAHFAQAKSLFEKDMTSFWKVIKNKYDTRLPLAPMVDKCIDEKDIRDMWQAHYKKLFNSVDSSKSKESVERKLHSTNVLKILQLYFDQLIFLMRLKVLRL